jgi:pimeloyl-[acyl-carrier protein] methyl ester esterase
MSHNKTPPLQVLAMHGWAGDARCWSPWRAATKDLNWLWQCGERGYGELPPSLPCWPAEEDGHTTRMVVGHSLGPHLVPADVLNRADIVVLLASFAAFVPPGRDGRRARAALAGMAASLADKLQAQTMLRNFMDRVATPQPADLLPPGPSDGPLDETNRARLREDLELLGRCNGLPAGFPRRARVLIVEAEEDRIVEPAARRMLREELPDAEVITLPGIGHALLAGDVIARVVEWVEKWRRSRA